MVSYEEVVQSLVPVVAAEGAEHCLALEEEASYVGRGHAQQRRVVC